MIPTEIGGVQYLAQENPILFQSSFGFLQSDIPNMPLNSFLSNLSNSTYVLSAGQDQFFYPPSCLSSNSTSDEADEHQLSIIDERKQRRMISNRESARRSRMRKQRHLDELWSQVIRLRNENHHLIDKLNHVSESHEKVLQENARLKEEASDLRQMVVDLQIGSSFAYTIREFDEVPCKITAVLRAESSN